MASVPYPSWLPCALQEGYGFQPVSPLIRTDFVTGRAMQRRMATSTPTRVSVSWMMKPNQAALFEKWYQQELSDGAAWFLCWLKTPLGMDYYRSRFVDMYEGGVLVGGRFWRFTATLELFNRPLLPDGSLAYPDVFLNAGLVDIAANREWPEA